MIERSRDFLDDPWHEETPDCSVLSESKGVGFPHYWFYKLEFVLWLSGENDMSQEQRKTFRITAKNSVEHISPQEPEEVDTNTVSPEKASVFSGSGRSKKKHWILEGGAQPLFCW